MKEEKYFKSTPMQELFKKYGHLLPDIEKEFIEKEKQQFSQQPSVQLNKTAEEIALEKYPPSITHEIVPADSDKEITFIDENSEKRKIFIEGFFASSQLLPSQEDKPTISGWEIFTNEQGVVMAKVNRDQLISLLKYIENVPSPVSLPKQEVYDIFIDELKIKIEDCNSEDDEISWGMQEGILISKAEAKKIVKWLSSVKPLIENKWISVDERLPEQDKVVFVATNVGGTSQCFHENGMWRYGFNSAPLDSILKITHWQPLPELPNVSSPKEDKQ